MPRIKSSMTISIYSSKTLNAKAESATVLSRKKGVHMHNL